MPLRWGGSSGLGPSLLGRSGPYSDRRLGHLRFCQELFVNTRRLHQKLGLDQHLPRAKTQSIANLAKSLQASRHVSAFDEADGVPVHPGLGRELLLRKAGLKPGGAKDSTHGEQKIHAGRK